MITEKRADGNYAENFVAAKLEQEGFSIIARNYQKKYGEIDIIAEKKDLLAFVEVKMRRSNVISMQEIITFSKQKKIIAVAKEYIARFHVKNKVCRFDAALVFLDGQNRLHMNYIPNAFQDCY